MTATLSRTCIRITSYLYVFIILWSLPLSLELLRTSRRPVTSLYTKLTPWSRVIPVKLTVPQLLKKFLASYATQKFITALIRSRHLSLSSAISIQSMPSSHFLNIHFSIILPSTPRSSECSLPLWYRHQNTVYTTPVSHTCHMPAHLILLDLITLIFSEECVS